MQKLTDLFDQYQHAFKLQAQALRLLDALSDIDNGTNPRITHARRRAFRRWDMRERRATRLYETWFNYRKALSKTTSPTLADLVRINEENPVSGSALIEGEFSLITISGDTFAATPAGAPENAKPEERSDRTAGAGQGKQPTARRRRNRGKALDLLKHYTRLPALVWIGSNRRLAVAGKKKFSDQPKPTSIRLPDCAIQDDPQPAHPSSMYQCPNYRPLSDGRFCACQRCNPIPA